MTKQVVKRAHARRALPAVYELAAFSVFGFCLAHGLSRSKNPDDGAIHWGLHATVNQARSGCVPARPSRGRSAWRVD